MEGHTFSVYREIIDEVLEKARADFQAEGADERVLDDLRMVRFWHLQLLHHIVPRIHNVHGWPLFRDWRC